MMFNSVFKSVLGINNGTLWTLIVNSSKVTRGWIHKYDAVQAIIDILKMFFNDSSIRLFSIDIKIQINIVLLLGWKHIYYINFGTWTKPYHEIRRGESKLMQRTNIIISTL